MPEWLLAAVASGVLSAVGGYVGVAVSQAAMKVEIKYLRRDVNLALRLLKVEVSQ